MKKKKILKPGLHLHYAKKKNKETKGINFYELYMHKVNA